MMKITTAILSSHAMRTSAHLLLYWVMSPEDAVPICTTEAAKRISAVQRSGFLMATLSAGHLPGAVVPAERCFPSHLKPQFPSRMGPTIQAFSFIMPGTAPDRISGLITRAVNSRRSGTGG